jgi:hypothetical protein
MKRHFTPAFAEAAGETAVRADLSGAEIRTAQTALCPTCGGRYRAGRYVNHAITAEHQRVVDRQIG